MVTAQVEEFMEQRRSLARIKAGDVAGIAENNIQ